MKLKKVLIYAAIACCNGTGDVMLKRGMQDLGSIELSHWTRIFHAFIDPWVVLGIVCLAGFFYSYLTALSWADLTFVLPISAVSFVLSAFLGAVLLHEHVSVNRWAGIALIAAGVLVVTRTQARTARERGPGA